MKTQLNISLVALSLLAAATPTLQAQTVTNPCPNRVISWNLDDWSTINPTDLAGLAPAVNWVDTFLNNITVALPDNTGTPTTLDIAYGGFNTWHVQANHPGLDANGTANREILNGFLNAGPAAWNPPTTNTFVSLTNVPYARYDVVVYFNSDASGRKSTIEGPTTTYNFSTVGSAVRSGPNALFLPTTETNANVYPSADFAFWTGLTNANARFTTFPKSGNDQWLGICAFQVIESSNVYVLYGPAPSSQIVTIGQSATFNVMAGGQDPRYQWRHGGVPISNATNATYTIASTVIGQDGAYDVVVTNSFSSVTSVVATLTFYTPKSLEWAASVDGVWNTTTANWKTNPATASTLYAETDNVLFSPLGSAQPTITLSDTRTPGSITVSNSSYTLVGGSLAGSGSLRLKNNATLILDTPDNRSGPTTIDAGSTLQLDNNDTAGSLGSGALTNNGAFLFNAAGDEAYGYPIYGSGNITNLGSIGTITLGNNVNANYLVQAGAGSLLLQGSNTLSGGMVVASGQLWARAADCLGLAPVIVTGGELQLIFGINFSGSSITLAGGLLHAGIGGSPTYQGQIILGADSTIQVDGGSLTLPNAAGLNGGIHNLATSGGGTLILGGTTNSWASLTIGGVGVAFNSSANLLIATPISGFGNLSQIGAGTLTLSGDNSAMNGTLSVSNGTLLVNAASGAFTAIADGGRLGGNGSIAGPVSISSSGTLAPGTAAIGTLTLNSDLNLAGNVSVKVNRSLSQSNDLVSVAGVLVNTGTGTVTVNNLGPALAAGNKFTLFSQPVSGGETLTITGASAVWTNKLALDGSIEVVSVGASQPRITTTTLVGGNLVFSGTNGTAGGAYQVFSSTNLPASWIQIGSGNFDVNGNFSVTNPVNPAEHKRFFRLQLP